MSRDLSTVRRPNRRHRSPGVMLRGRALGLGYWDDEASADGGKVRLRRRVRRVERQAFRAEVARDLV